MIPRVAHFVWFGKDFPYIYGWALRTAAIDGGFEKVILHHQDPLDDSDGWQIAKRVSNVEKRTLVPKQILGEVPGIGDELVAVYQRLTKPAARSNMIRVALLYLEGGVYLDTDVITVRSFVPLLCNDAFCGEERIVFPASLSKKKNPIRHLAAGARFVARDLCRRAPWGYRAFRRIEHLYPAVVNNAVLGAKRKSRAMYLLMERMVRMSSEKQVKRYALGTHLLEGACDEHPNAFTVYPTRYFFPVGPEVSTHWFKINASGDYRDLICEDTVCIHWYASVRTKSYVTVINDHWVGQYAGVRPLANLILRRYRESFT